MLKKTFERSLIRFSFEKRRIFYSLEENDLFGFLSLIFSGGDETSRPLKIPGVYFRKFLPLSNKVSIEITRTPWGKSVLWRVFSISVLWRMFSTMEDIITNERDNIITLEGIQYCGDTPQYCGGCSV